MSSLDWLEIKEFVKDTFKYIIFIIAILVIAIYVVGLQQVVGSSMSPNFKNNDIVILDKISYHFMDVKRNDVISLYYDDTKYLIKRVIGLPGEIVEFKNSNLYINGKQIEQEYLNGVVTEDFSLQELGYNTIPEDMYFVVGDNRGDSLDSRDKRLGLVSKKDIIGKVRLRIWPLNKISWIK